MGLRIDSVRRPKVGKRRLHVVDPGAVAEVEEPTGRGHRGGPDQDAGDWMRAFSEILRAPPEVEILRVDEMQTS